MRATSPITGVYSGLPALGTNVYLGIPALGTKVYPGLAAPVAKAYTFRCVENITLGAQVTNLDTGFTNTLCSHPHKHLYDFILPTAPRYR